MQSNYTIKQILEKSKLLLTQTIEVKGWVRSFRNNRFIALNDGSCMSNIQVVIDIDILDAVLVEGISNAASISVEGIVVESQGSGQEIEIQAISLNVLGVAPSEIVQETILQPKKHSFERLRDQAHLRFRTNTFASVMRVRNALSFAIHQYFNQQGFVQVHTPIITASDAEGAGEMFQVTSFTLNQAPELEDKQIDYSQDFFGRKTHLTVSGQLEGELACMGLGKIYTFGPTFRAENSNTSRHLAEFWMVEPEVAFFDLPANMDLAEDFIKYVIKKVLDHCQEDLNFLDKRFLEEENQKPMDQRSNRGLIERLNHVVSASFKRVSYTEAIDILKESKYNKKGKFQYPIEDWGMDLQSEHERYLVEKHFDVPVILFDYPSKIKAFYMRLNEDGKTVRAMDVLFPGIGEIIGGSQREERLDILEQKMLQMNISTDELWWYLDTRRLGTVPHSGFGLGFERLVLYVTGMSNIRDVIPFPRTPKSSEF